MFVIGKRPAPPPDLAETLKKLRSLTTGTLGHLTDFGYANGLQPLVRPSKAVGVAFTVKIPGLDGTALHQALSLVEPGEFLVVDTAGQRSRAMWGGIVSHAAVRAGVVGVAVDSPIVDWTEIVELGLPVWCAGGTTSTTGRRLGLEGQIQVPVQVGGAVVNPGDVVFADSDGLYFIAAADAADVAERVATREAREPGIKKRLDAGEKLADISGATELFNKLTT
jgi:4-hydroxy-4-methyl-2-oxoglutarate aldolase